MNGTYGIWHCDNYNSSNNTGCATADWVNAWTWPANDVDVPWGVDGDQNTYGRAYISEQGSGFIQLNYLLNRDLDPASNDNSPVGLNKAG